MSLALLTQAAKVTHNRRILRLRMVRNNQLLYLRLSCPHSLHHLLVAFPHLFFSPTVCMIVGSK